MVVDKSGGLSGIRRRDFLPFGEELGTSIGHRNAAGAGYLADQVRQKFTGYERDNETGLDFAQARYFGSPLGRFTSVDPENAGADPSNPQSWNGYVYAFNNPLANTDPDGRKVRICGLDGACTDAKTDLSDADFNKYFRDAKDIKLKDGNVYQNAERIGAYERQSFDDLSPQANAFIFGRGGMVDQSQRAKPVVEGLGTAATLQIATPFIGLTNAAFVGIDLIQNDGKPSLGTGLTLAASVILPPLKLLHGPEVYKSGLVRGSLEFWRKQSTEKIIKSLKPGAEEPLIVKPDGTIMQGNTRIKVLRERGVDANSLPRTPHK